MFPLHPAAGELFFMYATLLICRAHRGQGLQPGEAHVRGSLTLEAPMLLRGGLVILFTIGGFLPG